MYRQTEPGNSKLPVVVRSYVGPTYGALIEAFTADADKLSERGYEPAGQFYVEGSCGWPLLILGVILIPVVIGVFVLARLATSRPTGTLTVTYLPRRDS